MALLTRIRDLTDRTRRDDDYAGVRSHQFLSEEVNEVVLS